MGPTESKFKSKEVNAAAVAKTLGLGPNALFVLLGSTHLPGAAPVPQGIPTTQPVPRGALCPPTAVVMLLPLLATLPAVVGVLAGMDGEALPVLYVLWASMPQRIARRASLGTPDILLVSPPALSQTATAAQSTCLVHHNLAAIANAASAGQGLVAAPAHQPLIAHWTAPLALQGTTRTPIVAHLSRPSLLAVP